MYNRIIDIRHDSIVINTIAPHKVKLKFHNPPFTYDKEIIFIVREPLYVQYGTHTIFYMM